MTAPVHIQVAVHCGVVNRDPMPTVGVILRGVCSADSMNLHLEMVNLFIYLSGGAKAQPYTVVAETLNEAGEAVSKRLTWEGVWPDPAEARNVALHMESHELDLPGYGTYWTHVTVDGVERTRIPLIYQRDL